ncbi:MAG TPA: DUF58 domain-containing protein [Methanoregula sp.]|nr:DUF58 domain-containing protein [Methanoregula sp.]
MQCTRILALLAILLFAWSLVLDDMATLLVASLLLSALVGAVIIFEQKVREAVISVFVERVPERTQVRKGTTVQVTTSVTVTVPPGMTVTIQESLPSTLAIQDGITSVTAEQAAFPGTQKMTYRVTPLVHGEYPFSGIVLTLRDRFFETEMILSAPPFSGPSLLVQPTGLFESGPQRITAETREIEKMSVLSGFGIRALREYYAGDDMRKIDWKQTAKHDRIYVREYAGMMTLPPLIIIDLPGRKDTFSPADFEHMVAAVAGLCEYSVRTYQHVSILIISGPNIISFIEEEKDLLRCMTALRRWMHPVDRPVHLYRTSDRSDLRARIRTIDGLEPDETGDAVTKFLLHLRREYQAGLSEQRVLTFTGQIIRTIGQMTADEMYVFSLGCGDISHLRQLVRQARAMKVQVNLRVPSRKDPVWSGSSQTGFRVDSLEAFA